MNHKHLFLALVACLLSGNAPVRADDLDLADTAEAIREGDIDVGKR